MGIDERLSYLAGRPQNRGVFKSPWTKQETWTLSVWHTEDDAKRYVDNFTGASVRRSGIYGNYNVDYHNGYASW